MKDSCQKKWKDVILIYRGDWESLVTCPEWLWPPDLRQIYITGVDSASEIWVLPLEQRNWLVPTHLGCPRKGLCWQSGLDVWSFPVHGLAYRLSSKNGRKRLLSLLIRLNEQRIGSSIMRGRKVMKTKRCSLSSPLLTLPHFIHCLGSFSDVTWRSAILWKCRTLALWLRPFGDVTDRKAAAVHTSYQHIPLAWWAGLLYVLYRIRLSQKFRWRSVF